MTALEKIRRNIKGKLHWSSDQMTHYWSFSFSQKSVLLNKINEMFTGRSDDKTRQQVRRKSENDTEIFFYKIIFSVCILILLMYYNTQGHGHVRRYTSYSLSM